MSAPSFIDRRRLALGLGALTLAGPAQAADSDSREVVETMARLVEREYPDVALASAMARSLRSKARAGRYRGLATTALADALTADLRMIGHDEHLKVTYAPQDAALRIRADAPIPPNSPPTPSNPGPKAREIFGAEAYGLAAVRRLNGNIGLLTIDTFPPLYDLVKDRYAAAMGLLADSWGLILDLRDNGGGAADSPGHLLSYFFDREPFVLSRLDWRHYPPLELRTTRDIRGPNYGETRPVFVAVSDRTFSAAEAVAYELQAHRRAGVVGQRTRGGANPGDFFNLGGGFVAFTPQGRVRSLATGGNWEGTGVRPDIEAPPGAILRAAHRAAVEAVLTKTQDAERIAILNAALEEGPGGDGG